MDHLDKLPQWEKTEYYCLSRSIYRCRTGGNMAVSSKLSERVDLSLRTMKSDVINEVGEASQDVPKQPYVMRVLAYIKEKTPETWYLLKRWWSKNQH